jgi:hypothetical protein
MNHPSLTCRTAIRQYSLLLVTGVLLGQHQSGHVAMWASSTYTVPTLSTPCLFDDSFHSSIKSCHMRYKLGLGSCRHHKSKKICIFSGIF